MNRLRIFFLLLFMGSVCVPHYASADPPQFRVLMITKTLGWHHESVAQAVPAIHKLARKHQFELVWEENLDRVFTEEFLSDFDVIMFVLTSGDILDADQQVLLEKHVRSGKGFVGVHSAADTEYRWRTGMTSRAREWAISIHWPGITNTMVAAHSILAWATFPLCTRTRCSWNTFTAESTGRQRAKA